MDNKTVKKNILKKRLEKGLSQNEVAKLINISQTAYQKIEKGDTCIISDRLSQLAKILDIKEEELVLGYFPEESISNEKIEEIREDAIKEYKETIDTLKLIIDKQDLKIQELLETIKDKNELMSFLREKIK